MLKPPPLRKDSLGCFLDGMKVLMADGTQKNIEDINVGERVACHFRGSAEVVGKRVGPAGRNNFYLIDQNFITTGEHQFLTRNGWVAVESTGTERSLFPWREIVTDANGSTYQWMLPANISGVNMKVGDKILCGDTHKEVKSIEKLHHVNPNDRVTSLITGSNIIINEGIVAEAWPTKATDKFLEDSSAYFDSERFFKEITGQVNSEGRWYDN